MKYIKLNVSNKNGLWRIPMRYLEYFISFLYTRYHYLFHKPARKKYKISICAIFKNEGLFMKEWIEYHLLIGVEHFYLYNNLSDDNYQDLLKPYVDNGTVTLIEWPVPFAQTKAYIDCYNKYRQETEWIAYIDLDEFICLREQNDIKEWIHGFRRYPSVVLNWKMFGTSGHMNHEADSLVTEQYTASWPYPVNHGKSLINTSYDFSEFHIHLFFSIINIFGMKFRILPVDEFKKFLLYWIFRYPLGAESGIQINHYFTRSYAQHIYKNFVRTDAQYSNVTERQNPKRFALFETRNSTRDYTIQRFLILLKLRMQSDEH